MKILFCLLTFYVSSLYGGGQLFLNETENSFHIERGGTYFTFEQITERNYEMYNSLVRAEFSRVEQREENFKLLGVIGSLGKIVELSIADTDVWIAYTQQQRSGPMEMAVSFVTQKGIPIGSTMGIVRLPSFVESARPKTPHLSLRLLGFVAEASHHFYPEIRYFYTTPTEEMTTILGKGLPQKGVAWFKIFADQLLTNKHPEALNYLSSVPMSFGIFNKSEFYIKVDGHKSTFNVPHYFKESGCFVGYEVIIDPAKLREQFR